MYRKKLLTIYNNKKIKLSNLKNLLENYKVLFFNSSILIKKKELKKILKILNYKLKQKKLGFINNLKLNGISYRGLNLKNNGIRLDLGYSHIIEFDYNPKICTINLNKTMLTIYGLEKHLINSITNYIRLLHKPDCYKGKGIIYLNEKIKLKPGKQK